MLHFVVSAVAARVAAFDRLVTSSAAVAIHRGSLIRRVLRRERVSDADLAMLMRLRSSEIAEVEYGRLEPSGKLSLTKRADRRPAERRDHTWLRRLVA